MPTTILSALPFAHTVGGECIPANDYALQIYRQLDAQAVQVGEAIAANHKAGDPSTLNANGRETAALLAVDVRLAAIPTLVAAARGPNGIGRVWVDWYGRLLQAHVAIEANRAVLRAQLEGSVAMARAGAALQAAE